MDYQILDDWTSQGLTNQVKAALEAGWTLLGGASMVIDEGGSFHLIQTMVKHAEVSWNKGALKLLEDRAADIKIMMEETRATPNENAINKK